MNFFRSCKFSNSPPKSRKQRLTYTSPFLPSFAIFCLVSARFRRLTFYKICHFKSCVLQFRDKNKDFTENYLTKPKKISISFSKQFCGFICPQDFPCFLKGMFYDCLVKEDFVNESKKKRQHRFQKNLHLNRH